PETQALLQRIMVTSGKHQGTRDPGEDVSVVPHAADQEPRAPGTSKAAHLLRQVCAHLQSSIDLLDELATALDTNQLPAETGPVRVEASQTDSLGRAARVVGDAAQTLVRACPITPPHSRDPWAEGQRDSRDAAV